MGVKEDSIYFFYEPREYYVTMPVLLLERLPLPSLEAYAVLSVLLLAWSLHYAAESTLDPEWRRQFSEILEEENVYVDLLPSFLKSNWLGTRAFEILTFTIHEPMCIWTLVNMAYCLLVLFGNWLQKQVFGELRVSELQHIKDKFWNFVFYKFIFIFGIINVQSLEGLVMWGSWFSAIGFLHLHSQLCQDRFEYLSMTPRTPRKAHIRLMLLLSSILFLSAVLFIICIAVGYRAGWVTFLLVAPECLLLSLRTSHVLAKYAIYLRSLDRLSLQQSQGWSPVSYHVELVVEVTCLILDLAHHIHMLVRANMFLSMASLVIFTQLRVLYAQVLARLRRHTNYRRVLRLVQSSYPLVDLPKGSAHLEDFKCAICWDMMSSARKLPCAHSFHHGCLLLWMEQDPSCPTCRQQLLQGSEENKPPPSNQSTRSWMSWTGWSRLLQQTSETPASTVAENSQLESLAEQVQQMFPDYPMSTIIDDLRQTRSVTLTVDNILDGRLLPPLPMFQQEPLSPPAPVATSGKTLLNEEPPPIPDPSVSFADDPEQRQQMLLNRKRDLVMQARQRFAERSRHPDS